MSPISTIAAWDGQSFETVVFAAVAIAEWEKQRRWRCDPGVSGLARSSAHGSFALGGGSPATCGLPAVVPLQAAESPTAEPAIASNKRRFNEVGSTDMVP